MEIKGTLQVRLFSRKKEGSPEEMVQDINGFLDTHNGQRITWIFDRSGNWGSKILMGALIEYLDDYNISKDDFYMPLVTKEKRLLEMIKGGMPMVEAKKKLADEIMLEKRK